MLPVVQQLGAGPQTQIQLDLVPNSLARAAFSFRDYGKALESFLFLCVFFLFFFFLMKATPFETQVAETRDSRNALWS